MVQRHDVASLFQVDVSLMLVGHGLRSAAIIAVELLKQEQAAQATAQDGKTTTPGPPPLLPRSQTIQDLSVFAARLGAVDPTDGSFSICDEGRTVITRILDKILSPPPPPARQATPPSQPRSHGRAAEQMDVDMSVAAVSMAGLGPPEVAMNGIGRSEPRSRCELWTAE